VSKQSTLEIIIRTCDHTSVHNNKRIIDVDKFTLITTCIKSLLNYDNHKITVIDDHSSQKFLKFLKQYDVNLIQLERNGNNESLLECYHQGIDSEADLLYFVEDDYLYSDNAINVLYQAYHEISEITKKDVILSPMDDPFSYYPYRNESCRLIYCVGRHWRTDTHTTGTFLVSRNNLIKNWQHYMKFTQYNSNTITEDNSINLIYQKELLFTPIPTLALHLQSQSEISLGEDVFDWWGMSKMGEVSLPHETT